jgi:hypothetical protein
LHVVSAGTPDHGGVCIAESRAGRPDLHARRPDFIGSEAFTYTISDGNGGVDTAAVTVNSAFTDNFSSGTANWTFVSDSGSVILVDDRERRAAPAEQGGERQRVRSELPQGDIRLLHRRHVPDELPVQRGRAVPGRRTLQDDIGVMFRYQNSNNYYRLSMNTRYGFTRLEKKVAGTFTPLAVNARGYDDGQVLNFTIEVQGALIRIWINGDPAFALQDASLGSGSVALYTQDTASFDNVRIEGIPAIRPSCSQRQLPRRYRNVSSLSVAAIAGNVPAAAGWNSCLMEQTPSWTPASRIRPPSPAVCAG